LLNPSYGLKPVNRIKAITQKSVDVKDGNLRGLFIT